MSQGKNDLILRTISQSLSKTFAKFEISMMRLPPAQILQTTKPLRSLERG